MHADARVRCAVRHVRRFGDRVCHRGRIPVAQVPGETRDAEDHDRTSAPAQHAPTTPCSHRVRRWRLHPQFAGRHYGAEQVTGVQNGFIPSQTEQLIGDSGAAIDFIYIVFTTFYTYLYSSDYY